MGAPTGPIQILPQGLLGLLQLKNLGRNPDELAGILQPVLEMRDWYFQSQAQTVDIGTATLTNGTVGDVAFTTPVVVPENEYWFITEFALRTATLVSTDTLGFLPAYRVTAGSGLDLYPMAALGPALVGPDRRNYALAKDCWVPPGAELVIVASVCLTSTSIVVAGSLRKTVLRI